MERAEAAAEGRGGGDRAAPRPAGEGSADERGEGREAEEDLQHEVVAEFVYGWSPASLPTALASAATGHGCSGSPSPRECTKVVRLDLFLAFRRRRLGRRGGAAGHCGGGLRKRDFSAFP